MFNIKKKQVEAEAQKASAKIDLVHGSQVVFDEVKLSFLNLVETITALKIYNAAHWILNIDRWQNNLKSDNKTTYRRGEIIFLDLGAQNFKFEPSYTHACIVLANRSSSILIVPCSTKKYGSGYPDIIDATPADGFMRNTGIQAESFRWVNKNRVVSKTGKAVSPRILGLLDDRLVSFAPSNKKTMRQLSGEVAKLQAEIETLKKQLP